MEERRKGRKEDPIPPFLHSPVPPFFYSPSHLLRVLCASVVSTIRKKKDGAGQMHSTANRPDVSRVGRIRGFEDSRIRGFRESRIQGIKGSRALGAGSVYSDS